MTASEKTETTRSKPMFTVVIPVYNEIGTIDSVYEKVSHVLASYDRDYEMIFVDDGSSDGSTERLREFALQDSKVRSVIFSRNFGQQEAVTAGFDLAKGEYILTMDADLQVDPEDIPSLIEKMDEGFDIVAGYRERREEGFVTRRIPSILINKFFKKFLRLPYRDMGCGMQAYRKTILEGVDPRSALNKHRVLFAVWRGGKFADVPVHYQARQSGDSKYGLTDLVYLTLEMVILFLTQPLQLVVFFILGSILTLCGTAIAIAAIAAAITGATVSLWSTAMLLLLTGILFITFGFTNERLNRLNHRWNAAPLYVIDEIIETRKEKGSYNHG